MFFFNTITKNVKPWKPCLQVEPNEWTGMEKFDNGCNWAIPLCLVHLHGQMA